MEHKESQFVNPHTHTKNPAPKGRRWFCVMLTVLLFLLPGCSLAKKADDIQPSIPDPNEIVTVYCLDTMNMGERTRHFTYDDQGNLLTGDHRYNGRTVRTYDENGNILTEQVYVGNELSESEQYTYDSRGNILTYENNWGRRIVYTYNTADRMTSQTQFISSKKDPVIRTLYFYDDANNLLLQEEYANNASEPTSKYVYTYDANGNMLSQEYFGFAAEPIPSSRSEWVYRNEGNPLEKYLYKDGELVNRTAYTYDQHGNLILQQDEGPSRQRNRIEQTFDDSGNILSYKQYSLYVSITDTVNETLQRYVIYRYDQKGNILEEDIRVYSENNEPYQSTVWTYNDSGTVQSKVQTMHYSNIESTWLYNEHGNMTTYSWHSPHSTGEETYTYVSFQLPRYKAERIQTQQAELLESLRESNLD